MTNFRQNYQHNANGTFTLTEYYNTPELRDVVKVTYEKRKKFGEYVTEVKVTWSACGAQTAESAKGFAEALSNATQRAAYLENYGMPDDVRVYLLMKEGATRGEATALVSGRVEVCGKCKGVGFDVYSAACTRCNGAGYVARAQQVSQAVDGLVDVVVEGEDGVPAYRAVPEGEDGN